jgi:cation transport regulator ChaB
MPYTMDNPPEQLKDHPRGLIRQWIAVFNQVVADGGDEDAARKQAWGAVKKSWEQDQGGNWVKKRAAEFGEMVDDVEIMRTGTHTASSGSQVTFTAEDLERIAAGYRPEYHEAPVVIGHPADNQPAYGWVKGLKRVGERLLASLDLVPAFADAVRQGLFKKRSASIYSDLDGQGPYLRHIGFLGAMPPAVKALADINLDDGRVSETIEFSNKEGAMSWKDKVKNLFTQAVDEIPESGAPVVVIKDSGPDPNRNETTQFSEEEVAEREAAAAKKARDEALAEFAEERRRKDAEAASVAHTATVAAKIDALVNGAKVPPAWVKGGLVEFVQALPWGDDAVVEFADADGKPAKMNPCDWFLGFLEGLPKFINLSEVAGGDKDVTVGAASTKVEALITKKLADNQGMAYSQAFAEVQREHHELAAQYADELRG